MQKIEITNCLLDWYRWFQKLIMMCVPVVLFSCATIPRDFEGNLLEISINELQVAYTERIISATDVVRYYQRRIAEIDPQLNSVIQINPDALTIAAALDAERELSLIHI